MFLGMGLASFGQECTKVNFPADGAPDIPVDVTISWPEVSGINGYLISLGTTIGGTEILDRHATGIVNSYQAPVGLPENTLIYVTISVLAFNATPVDCESTTFTTMDVTTSPACTFLVAPDDNAANVTVVTDIIWQYAPTATSYTLSIGTSEGASDILDRLNVGNVLSYDPPVDLPQDVRIFVTVIPQNENGPAPPCNEESFYTGALDDPCEVVDSISGQVISLSPEIEFPNLFVKCIGSQPISVQAEGDADGFRWLKVENNVETLLSENRNYQINDYGNFVLEAYNNVNRSGTIIQCTTTNNFNVIPSEPAIIESIEIKQLTVGKQVTVNVVGQGDYEYTLDDENGPYQDDNVFINVADGPHLVIVRDKNGCGIVSRLIERGLSMDDFPNFFTPNGDGINDFWQFIKPPEITDILEVVNGKISIFNRYGILLVEIDPKSRGWDGSFNGSPLPASDYWYRAVSFDQKEIKGHFTLKR